MFRVKLLIADDHAIVREAIAERMSTRDFVREVRQAGDGKAALKVAREFEPDVVLMDIQLPEMDGIDCSRELLKTFPRIKIIVLTALEDPRLALKLIEMGIHGFCLKSIPMEELDRAIISVVENDFFHNDLVVKIMRHEIVTREQEQAQTNYKVNDRERKMLKLMCQEKTNAEIAEELALSPRTLEKIRNDLARKLNVKGMIGLVKYAVMNGYDI